MNTAAITPAQNKGRIALLCRTKSFLNCKDNALEALKCGRPADARFWGRQARFDWSFISAAIASPNL